MAYGLKACSCHPSRSFNRFKNQLSLFTYFKFIYSHKNNIDIDSIEMMVMIELSKLCNSYDSS